MHNGATVLSTNWKNPWSCCWPQRMLRRNKDCSLFDSLKVQKRYSMCCIYIHWYIYRYIEIYTFIIQKLSESARILNRSFLFCIDSRWKEIQRCYYVRIRTCRWTITGHSCVHRGTCNHSNSTNHTNRVKFKPWHDHILISGVHTVRQSDRVQLRLQ